MRENAGTFLQGRRRARWPSICLLALVLLCAYPGRARADDSWGAELDALPYLTGGYYGSLWYGREHVRARVVVAQVNVPSFMLSGGYRDKRLDVYALVVDWFAEAGFQGWWFGAGMEYWKGSIGHGQESVKGNYHNTVATAGVGYVWKFHPHFYLNPWVAGHLMAGGDTDAVVGSRNYRIPPVVAEASLKIGWEF